MSARHKARGALIRALYMAESREFPVSRAFEEMTRIDRDMEAGIFDPDEPSPEPFGLGIDDEGKAFALELAAIIEREKNDFDKRIAAVLENWDLSRVSRIDRYILWIALAEATKRPDIPVRVSMNEAIELARSYSSGKSTKFINRVLDAVLRDLGILDEPPDVNSEGNRHKQQRSQQPDIQSGT